MSRRGRSNFGQFAATLILATVLLVFVSALLVRHEPKVDLTAGHRRTLAPQTLRVIESVERPIEVLAFYPAVPEERQLFQALIERYDQVKGVFDLRFVDPERRPDLAESLDVTESRTVVLRDGDLRVRVGDPDEAALTGALLRILQASPPVIFVVTGHGEASVEDESPAGLYRAAQMLVAQNFELRILSTAAVERIPADAGLLWLPAPEGAFTAGERTIFEDYLLRGGRLLAMVEPGGSASADSLLFEFGIQPGPGFVIDISPEQRNLSGGGDPRIAAALVGNGDHPITRSLGRATLFPLARGLRATQPPPSGATPSRLVQTGPSSWVETTPPTGLDDVPTLDPGSDFKGPIPLAFAVEFDLKRFTLDRGADRGLTATFLDLAGDRIDLREDLAADSLATDVVGLERERASSARLVAFGDVDFANNANLMVHGNSELLLSSVLWLTEQDNRIALPARPDLSDPILLTSRQLGAIRWLGIGALPALFFLIAAWTLWRRRSWL